jgi:hypothetical protein
MSRYRFPIALVGVMFASIVVSAWGLDGRSVDDLEALVHLGERLGCRVPTGELPGVRRVWIVEREAGTAYAAWCARQTSGQLVYDLVIAATSQQHPWASCPNHVRLGVQEPFSQLRAAMLPRDLPYSMKLSDFWYLRGDDYLIEKGPPVRSAKIPNGPAIDFGEDGAGQMLLCLGNRWIMGGYH